MSGSIENPFSSESLAGRMVSSLARTTSPQVKNAVDVLALAAHAAMLAVDFRLIGLGEEDRIEAPSDPSTPSVLPAAWNASSGGHNFRYAHSQSSMEFLLKTSKMGSKVVVMGMAIGDDKTCTFDVTAKEYVLESNLPSTPVPEDANEQTAIENIIKLFLGYSRPSDFGTLMHIKIIRKLAPGINKAGESSTEEETQSAQPRDHRNPRDPNPPTYDPLRDDRDPPARPYPFNDPLAIPPGPRRPMPEPMPGFEDEFETQRPLRGGFPGGAGFPRIGDQDLYPQGLGPNDPLRGGPGFGPGRGGIGGGGMHPTFDDPLFTGQGQGGYDPRNPPGSRYDPVGPGMGGHPRGAGMGGRPPNPFGGFGQGDFI